MDGNGTVMTVQSDRHTLPEYESLRGVQQPSPAEVYNSWANQDVIVTALSSEWTKVKGRCCSQKCGMTAKQCNQDRK